MKACNTLEKAEIEHVLKKKKIRATLREQHSHYNQLGRENLTRLENISETTRASRTTNKSNSVEISIN